jgi:hypothetical protein
MSKKIKLDVKTFVRFDVPLFLNVEIDVSSIVLRFFGAAVKFGNGLYYFKNISNLLSFYVLVSADPFNLQT